MELAEVKRLERLAENKNLKDYGTKGIGKDGNPKEGYVKTRAGYVYKVSDIEKPAAKKSTNDIKVNDAQTVYTQKQLEDMAAKAAKKGVKLRNLKGIGLDDKGNLKPNFAKLPDGKVVSIKHLEDAQ